MFNAITAVGMKLKNEVLFIASAAILLTALAYQNHEVFMVSALLLFAVKVHLDMSEAVMTEARN